MSFRTPYFPLDGPVNADAFFTTPWTGAKGAVGTITRVWPPPNKRLSDKYLQGNSRICGIFQLVGVRYGFPNQRRLWLPNTRKPECPIPPGPESQHLETRISKSQNRTIDDFEIWAFSQTSHGMKIMNSKFAFSSKLFRTCKIRSRNLIRLRNFPQNGSYEITSCVSFKTYHKIKAASGFVCYTQSHKRMTSTFVCSSKLPPPKKNDFVMSVFSKHPIDRKRWLRNLCVL